MKNKKGTESLATRTKRMKAILAILERKYPQAEIQLQYQNPFELLVATILSAQCTDARVNIVTKELFKKYHYPSDYISAPTDELERYIFSTGFYKAKAKHIQGAAKAIIERFNGEVPQTMDKLLELPGVGRKTANVVLGHCFDTPGIVVDTHVIRISNRLGFVETENAEKIEFELMTLIEKNKWWVAFTHVFIQFGRETCIARKPKCSECEISSFCPACEKLLHND
ncbi:MAG: endonuclease III [Candidatus Kapabacteria bacterium]|nr:endonuclease III [Candidatus Kapabacteria bacterium]